MAMNKKMYEYVAPVNEKELKATSMDKSFSSFTKKKSNPIES